MLQKVFGEIVIPLNVFRETLELKSFGYDLTEFETSSWIITNSPQKFKSLEKRLAGLDEGEADAIALAIELHADLILIDERLASAKARELGLKVTGLLGVVLEAKEKGIIKSGRDLVDLFRNVGGLWISDKFYEQVIETLNEK